MSDYSRLAFSIILSTQTKPMFFSIAKTAFPKDPFPSSLKMTKLLMVNFFIAGFMLIFI